MATKRIRSFTVVIDGHEHELKIGSRGTTVDGKPASFAIDTAARMLAGNLPRKEQA